MRDLHRLSIGGRINFKILLLTCKILHDLARYNLSSLLLKYQPARLLCSSNRLLLQVLFVNTVAYGYRSFSFSLPDHVKNSESLSTFKQRFKTFLFRNNYCLYFHVDFI